MTSNDARGSRGLTRLRRVGYRVLPGDAFSYVLHTRSLQWPVMALNVTVGFALATRWRLDQIHAHGVAYLIALIAWAPCLFGGTLALNSATDRDASDIGGLLAPPPPPRYLAAFGVTLMLAGVPLVLQLPAPSTALYLGCVALSIVYSVPPIRWKARPGLDLAVNVVGFGLATPYAGWAATGEPLTAVGALGILGFGMFTASLYPLTQLYQLADDAQRGDRTFARAIGVRATLLFSLAMAALTLVWWTTAFLSARRPVSAAVVAVPVIAWGLALYAWFSHRRTYGPTHHQAALYRLGHLAIATTACLIVAAAL